MTVDEQVLFWGAICYAIMLIFVAVLAYLLFWCWKKRIAIIAGRYGGGGQYSRDLQPIRYWAVMLFYASALVLISTGLFIRGREWVELLLKFLRNH